MPPRIFVYGMEGIGKSTFASQAPKPIFNQTEGGLDESNFYIRRFWFRLTLIRIMPCRAPWETDRFLITGLVLIE
jgi:hypothetical protein